MQPASALAETLALESGFQFSSELEQPPPPLSVALTSSATGPDNNAPQRSCRVGLRSKDRLEPRLPEDLKIKLFDMVLCFSRALDLLHPAIADHHLRVAYIACCLAEEMGFSMTEIQNVLIAGALHDAGAVSSAARSRILDYALGGHRLDDAEIPEDIHMHGFEGFVLTRDFPPSYRRHRPSAFTMWTGILAGETNFSGNPYPWRHPFCASPIAWQ